MEVLYDYARDDTNPYIALADLAINLVLILAFVVAAANAIGRAGWEKIRYREAQEKVAAAVNAALAHMPEKMRPRLEPGKNDPPGAQRWVFGGGALFHEGARELRPQGQNAVGEFARVVEGHRDSWRRIRVEGHTQPPGPGELDDWDLSAARAARVARVMHTAGHIESYFLAVAGRAGQDPGDRGNPASPRNERVEIVIEYAEPRGAPATAVR